MWATLGRLTGVMKIRNDTNRPVPTFELPGTAWVPHPSGWKPPVPRAILEIGEGKFLSCTLDSTVRANSIQ